MSRTLSGLAIALAALAIPHGAAHALQVHFTTGGVGPNDSADPTVVGPLSFEPFDSSLGQLTGARFQINFGGSVTYAYPSAAYYALEATIHAEVIDQSNQTIADSSVPLDVEGRQVDIPTTGGLGDSKPVQLVAIDLAPFVSGAPLTIRVSLILEQLEGPAVTNTHYNFHVGTGEGLGTYDYVPVPEPATAFLGALALTFLAIIRR
jgi:hypothetical protein